MAAESVVVPPSSPPIVNPASGTTLATVAGWLMLGAAIAEFCLRFEWHNHGVQLHVLALTTSGFVRMIAEPANWSTTRLWARVAMTGFALIVILLSLLFFVSCAGELAQAARDSFHGVRLQLFLVLPAGFAGLVLTFIAALRFEYRGRIFSSLAIAGAWSLLPYLFPVSLPLLVWFAMKRDRFFPEPQKALS